MGWGLSCPSLAFPLAGPRRTAPELQCPVATLGLPKVSLDSNTGTHMEEQGRGAGQSADLPWCSLQKPQVLPPCNQEVMQGINKVSRRVPLYPVEGISKHCPSTGSGMVQMELVVVHPLAIHSILR